MAGRESGARVVPVERAELATHDMELIAELIGQLYVEHRARFRCADPSRVDGSVHSATAGELSACLMRYGGFGYDARTDPRSDPHAVVVLEGDGVVSPARRDLYFTGGDAFMPPPDKSHVTRMHNVGLAMVQVPWAVVGRLAEEATGLPAADLRFESMPPVSAARQAAWTRTAGFICHELISSGITEVSPLMAQEMTQLAGRAVQHAFRRYYGITPTRYLRRARLLRAHQQLRATDPASGVAVAAVARQWGWASPSRFSAAYRRQFDLPPSQTLSS